MEKKQTAVEWLFENINDLLIQWSEGKISASVYGIRATEYKYKAKEMEREQIKSGYENGSIDMFVSMNGNPEKPNSNNYYDETYGK